MNKLRIWAKTLLTRFYGGVIEFCDDCGVRQPLVWTSSDPLWAEVTGKESVLTDGGGVLCPSCFDKKAKARGLLLRWVPVIEYRGHERIESHDTYMAMLTGELEAKASGCNHAKWLAGHDRWCHGTQECDHGVVFDEEKAKGMTALEVRKAYPRMDGHCPKGCGFYGSAYASFLHYVSGDW